MAVAPPGMTQVFPMMCGTCSNENGIKMMFMRYMNKQRKGRVEFTEEELSSVLKHQEPGSPKLSILSFKGAFHGRSLGLLSCSNSRPIQGVDIPTLPWPKADFPKYKYPLVEHARENAEEDARCLALVEELIESASTEGQPVAGVISEPIQAEGGDNHASAEFFRGLAEICARRDISLMMDEVQTGGGATGKMWCHEHFGIQADVVSFSKKMLSGGIYHNLEHRPPHPGRILNTWVGDPHKIIMLEQVSSVVLHLRCLLTALRRLSRRFARTPCWSWSPGPGRRYRPGWRSCSSASPPSCRQRGAAARSVLSTWRARSCGTGS